MPRSKAMKAPGTNGGQRTRKLKDDAGMQSKNIIPGNKKSCDTFPLSAYEFAEIRVAKGDSSSTVARRNGVFRNAVAKKLR